MMFRRAVVLAVAAGLNLATMASGAPVALGENPGVTCSDLNGARCWVNCEDANQQQNGGCPDQPHPGNPEWTCYGALAVACPAHECWLITTTVYCNYTIHDPE